MTAMGHEDQFLPAGPSDRCWFGQATFAGTHGDGREAPEAVVLTLAAEREESTRSGPRKYLLHSLSTACRYRISYEPRTSTKREPTWTLLNGCAASDCRNTQPRWRRRGSTGRSCRSYPPTT